MIARALGIDPVEFRRKNILRDGRPHASGTIMRDAAIDRVLDTLADKMNWTAPFDRGSGVMRRGRGVAIGFKACGRADHVGRDGQHQRRRQHDAVDEHRRHGAGLRYRDGADRRPRCSTCEAEDVRVLIPDTDVTPYDMGTLGSRSTFHMGLAVQRAAEDARDKLKALAAEVGLPPGTNVSGRRRFSRSATACRPAM